MSPSLFQTGEPLPELLIRRGVRSCYAVKGNRRAGPQASNLVLRALHRSSWPMRVVHPWRPVKLTGLGRGGIVSLEVRAGEAEEQVNNTIPCIA